MRTRRRRSSVSEVWKWKRKVCGKFRDSWKYFCKIASKVFLKVLALFSNTALLPRNRRSYKEQTFHYRLSDDYESKWTLIEIDQFELLLSLISKLNFYISSFATVGGWPFGCRSNNQQRSFSAIQQKFLSTMRNERFWRLWILSYRL